jgi:hypothetical protein
MFSTTTAARPAATAELRRHRRATVITGVCLALTGCGLSRPWASAAPALRGSDPHGAVVTFGFGGMTPGATCYMLGPQLSNQSKDPITVVSVTATPSSGGATNTGWRLERVPASGPMTAFCPTADPQDARFAAQIVDVTSNARTLAPHTELDRYVNLYVGFVVHRAGAYKSDQVTVTYSQRGKLHRARYTMGYRFGTPDAAPLP